MDPMQMFAAQIDSFKAVLANLLSPDNEVRTKAESMYDGISPGNRVCMLIQIVEHDSVMNTGEAELAAVLLRRLFFNKFEHSFAVLCPDIQQQIKQRILLKIQQTTSSVFRKKLCDVASELARNLIDDDGNNSWPEFLKFLFECATSPISYMREASLLMFSAVPGVFGNEQQKYIQVIRNMLCTCLSNGEEPQVCLAAVKALASFLLAHEKEVNVQRQLGECLPLLLEILKGTLEEPDSIVDDVLRNVLDIVESCPQYFKPHLDTFLDLCLKSISSDKAESETRFLGLEVFVSIAESAPGMIRKLASKHIPIIVTMSLKMMTTIEDDPNWILVDEEDTDEDSESEAVYGEAALDRLACALGGKTILPLVLTSLPQLLQSTLWNNRHAGLMAISAVGEGVQKQLLPMLPNIVEGIFPFLEDSNARVRHAACNALGQMAADFCPTFQKKFHCEVIGRLLEVLDDSNARVQAHAAAALVNFFEDCPKKILLQYTSAIVDKLEALFKDKLQDLFQYGKKLVLEQAIVTIASVADNVQDEFVEYYERFMPLLKFILNNATTPEYRVLRGKTIECISLIGMAVGKFKFLPDANEVMDVLMKTQWNNATLPDDDPQAPYMSAAWARMCKILGKSFEPYLPFIITPVLKAAALKPEVALLDSDDVKVIEDEDNWEFVNLGEKHSFGIHTSCLEEKSSACQMLVCYAKELKEGFAPYAEETLKLMVPMLKFYFHENILFN